MTESPSFACSVVIPTYNRAEELARLLEALRGVVDSGRAKECPVEVIVIDDGSRDNTACLLSQHTWLRSERQANAGAATARNRGWRIADSPIVAFIDDDCIPGQGWPFGLLGEFDNPAVAGVGGAILSQRSTMMDQFVEIERLVDHGRELDGTLDYIVTANAAYRRDMLTQSGGFDESFAGAAGEDVALSWRIRQMGGLLVRSGCAVQHHHRTTMVEVMRTYFKHGRARVLLDARYPNQSASRSARRVVSIEDLRKRWQAYRSNGSGRITASALISLRFVGLGVYAAGMAVANRRYRQQA